MAAQKKQKVCEERNFLFSSESVNEGHPDKLSDQVSDAVLDACLKVDPKSKVACETACKDNMVMVFGEITTGAKLDYEKIVRTTVQGIGYDSFVDDLASVESKGLSCWSQEVQVRINKQSPDIAGGVHVGKDEMDVGAGDQGIMFGYASDETEDCMPLTHLVATRLGKKLTDVRKDGSLWWLRPDGKTQVTVEYKQHSDGSVEPLKVQPTVTEPSLVVNQSLPHVADLTVAETMLSSPPLGITAEPLVALPTLRAHLISTGQRTHQDDPLAIRHFPSRWPKGAWLIWRAAMSLFA